MLLHNVEGDVWKVILALKIQFRKDDLETTKNE